LNIAYAVALEVDLNLVVLDVPVPNRGEPAERPPSLGYHALAAVQQRPIARW